MFVVKPNYHNDVCPPYVRCMSATIFGACSPYFHRMFAVWPPYVRRMFAICPPTIRHIYAVCPQYVRRMSIICPPYIRHTLSPIFPNYILYSNEVFRKIGTKVRMLYGRRDDNSNDYHSAPRRIKPRISCSACMHVSGGCLSVVLFRTRLTSGMTSLASTRSILQLFP